MQEQQAQRLNRVGRSGSLWQPSPSWSAGLPLAQQYRKGDRCRFLGSSRGLKVRTLYGNAKMWKECRSHGVGLHICGAEAARSELLSDSRQRHQPGLVVVRMMLTTPTGLVF